MGLMGLMGLMELLMLVLIEAGFGVVVAEVQKIKKL